MDADRRRGADPAVAERIAAGRRAYEDACIQGLCPEGAREIAEQAMRAFDLSRIVRGAATLGVLMATLAASPASAQQSDSANAAVAEAQSAADGWLRLVDQMRYDESWDSAAAPFRQAVARADWGEAVLQARHRLEPIVARKLLRGTFTTTLPDAPAGDYVVLQYEAQGARGTAVVETVTPMREADRRWRVAGYFVRTR